MYCVINFHCIPPCVEVPGVAVEDYDIEFKSVQIQVKFPSANEL